MVMAAMTHSSSLTILWTPASIGQILLSFFKLCVCVGGGSYRGQKSVSDPLELWLQVTVREPMQVPETELGSSVGIVHALDR